MYRCCWAGHVTECHSVYCVVGVEGGWGHSSEGACMQGGCICMKIAENHFCGVD